MLLSHLRSSLFYPESLPIYYLTKHSFSPSPIDPTSPLSPYVSSLKFGLLNILCNGVVLYHTHKQQFPLFFLPYTGFTLICCLIVSLRLVFLTQNLPTKLPIYSRFVFLLRGLHISQVLVIVRVMTFFTTKA